jgi:hypothetical protein
VPHPLSLYERQDPVRIAMFAYRSSFVKDLITANQIIAFYRRLSHPEESKEHKSSHHIERKTSGHFEPSFGRKLSESTGESFGKKFSENAGESFGRRGSHMPENFLGQHRMSISPRKLSNNMESMIGARRMSRMVGIRSSKEEDMNLEYQLGLRRNSRRGTILRIDNPIQSSIKLPVTLETLPRAEVDVMYQRVSG